MTHKKTGPTNEDMDKRRDIQAQIDSMTCVEAHNYLYSLYVNDEILLYEWLKYSKTINDREARRIEKGLTDE